MAANTQLFPIPSHLGPADPVLPVPLEPWPPCVLGRQVRLPQMSWFPKAQADKPAKPSDQLMVPTDQLQLSIAKLSMRCSWIRPLANGANCCFIPFQMKPGWPYPHQAQQAHSEPAPISARGLCPSHKAQAPLPSPRPRGARAVPGMLLLHPHSPCPPALLLQPVKCAGESVNSLDGTREKGKGLTWS